MCRSRLMREFVVASETPSICCLANLRTSVAACFGRRVGCIHFKDRYTHLTPCAPYSKQRSRRSYADAPPPTTTTSFAARTLASRSPDEWHSSIEELILSTAGILGLLWPPVAATR